MREIILSWTDRLLSCFEKIRPADQARRLPRAYSEAFGPDFIAATDPEVALKDILCLEEMKETETKASISFSVVTEENEGLPFATEMKLFLIGEKLVLSDFMPNLDNMALRVIDVTPFEIEAEDALEAVIYSFSVKHKDGRNLAIKNGGGLLAEAILAVRDGDATSDGLNALVLRS